jgi:hypothetical protein
VGRETIAEIRSGMAQGKPIPTVLKKQGRRVVTFRDAKGKTYNGFITGRTSASAGTFTIWRGGKKYVGQTKNVVSTTMHQADVVRFTGH